MLETLLATIGVMFTPMLTEGYVFNLIVIVGITVVTNIVRAFRWCRDGKGRFESFGISYGIQKGVLCGVIAMAASMAVSFIPILRVPFTVISFIPGLGSMVDGFVLAVFYLLSYMMIAYPIWGSC